MGCGVIKEINLKLEKNLKTPYKPLTEKTSLEPSFQGLQFIHLRFLKIFCCWRVIEEILVKKKSVGRRVLKFNFIILRPPPLKIFKFNDGQYSYFILMR